MIQIILFTKQKHTHRLENKLRVARGQRWGERIEEFWMHMYTLLYLK